MILACGLGVIPGSKALQQSSNIRGYAGVCLGSKAQTEEQV